MILGLTGGIGCGKSRAVSLMAERGVPTICSDAISRRLTGVGGVACPRVAETFGKEFVGSDGAVCRPALATLVFSDPEKRAQLNAIIHPLVRAEWQEFIRLHREAGTPVAVVDIPLLFETGAELFFDAVVSVGACADTQRQRLEQRGWTPGQIASRIASQWSVARKCQSARFVLWNDGSIGSLMAQIERLLEFILPHDGSGSK